MARNEPEVYFVVLVSEDRKIEFDICSGLQSTKQRCKLDARPDTRYFKASEDMLWKMDQWLDNHCKIPLNERELALRDILGQITSQQTPE